MGCQGEGWELPGRSRPHRGKVPVPAGCPDRHAPRCLRRGCRGGRRRSPSSYPRWSRLPRRPPARTRGPTAPNSPPPTDRTGTGSMLSAPRRWSRCGRGCCPRAPHTGSAPSPPPPARAGRPPGCRWQRHSPHPCSRIRCPQSPSIAPLPRRRLDHGVCSRWYQPGPRRGK